MIPQERLMEYAHCAADKWYFISSYAKIRDPQSGRGIIPLDDWPHLHQLIDIIEANDRVIVLKARQLGITWVLCALALWYVLFQNSANVLMFSRRENEAAAMKNRVFLMYEQLPEWLQIPIGKNNDEMLEFPTMGSMVQSFPSTEGGARSDSATICILDEWAFQHYADTNYTAVLPAVEHGKLVGLSTANGKGNTFSRIWHEAMQRLNSFIPVFIPYTARPGRDEAWHKKQEADMPSYMAWQEYPLNWKDAFLVAGTCMFPVDILHEMPKCSPSLTIGPIQIWSDYNPDHTYVAGIDGAQGITGRDASVLHVIDVTSGLQAAKIHTNMPIEKFSIEALKLLNRYHNPMTCVEEQGQGRLVIKILIDGEEKTQDTPEIPGHSKHKIYHRAKNIPGFHTSSANRPEILSELEQSIRNHILTIFSEETIDEMMGFGYNETNNKFEALDGHDDEVMALALAWHMATNQPPPLGDMTATSYIDGPIHMEGEPVQSIDWSKVSPFDNTRVDICWDCEAIEEQQYTCRTCRGRGRILVYVN